ncbi:MAG: prephenate dehydratase domain-containing protein, partial [Acidimicrobiia bacterium]
MPPVAFFGPSGTFTEEALLSQPDLAASERVALASIPDVLAAVERGEHELGVVPIENSIEGSVSVTLDSLVFEHDLLIQREVDLPISLNLFAQPGTVLRDVTTVLSYPHAIAQCRTWLSQKLPDATIVAANST